MPLVGPLRRATVRAGHRFGDLLSGEKGVDRLTGVVFFDRVRVTKPGIVDATGVAELSLFVEEEEVWRCRCSVGFADALGLPVVEKGKVKLEIGGMLFHVFERIAVDRITEFVEADRLRIVRRNRDELKTRVGVVIDDRLDAGLRSLRARAVIAGEENREDVGVFVILKRVLFAIDTGQVEGGCRRSDLQGFHLFGCGGCRAEKGGDGDGSEPCRELKTYHEIEGETGAHSEADPGSLSVPISASSIIL